MSVRIMPTPLRLPAVAQRAGEDGSVARWYGGAFVDREWERRVRGARDGARPDWLKTLLPALEPAGAARERIERVAAEGGIVVTAGQQPGLFGGPLYTWHKALSALALADELERRFGVPAAPVFWAATDDSDLAEATTTAVATPTGFETIALDRTVERETPMSAVPVGDARHALERLAAACGSASSGEILETVRAAYASDNTLGGAYVQLLRSVFEPLGVTVLDAAHQATRAAGSPVTRQALQRAQAVAGRLEERTQELRALGLKPQVRHIAGRTLVFAVNGTRRTRVRLAEAVDLADRAQPHELSPNVLLRPIVERYVLPTVAYVGGPAEVAYFAQVSAVAEVLEMEAPHIVPRWSGFLIEAHVQRALEALGAGVEDLRDPHAVESRIAREELPVGVRDALRDARARARDLAPDLMGPAQAADLPVSSGMVIGAVGQLEHKLDRLERRIVAAVKRRGSERLALLAMARGALFPQDVPQERALNAIPLLARYGQEPLTSILAAARRYVAEI